MMSSRTKNYIKKPSTKSNGKSSSDGESSSSKRASESSISVSIGSPPPFKSSISNIPPPLSRKNSVKFFRTITQNSLPNSQRSTQLPHATSSHDEVLMVIFPKLKRIPTSDFNCCGAFVGELILALLFFSSYRL
ncbi:hypothetical protein L2E82_39601 [Cichorium intybus]|uniref:Uncharacterized protein n=1 Tax=Cichorium intybus TaxID=13427 RepID=A0ACB9AKD8_CICIN|nr:hypothetical protein L2E82_39601 [Cichorium intybus]